MRPSILPDQELIRSRCFHRAGDFVEFAEQEVRLTLLDRWRKVVLAGPERIALRTRTHQLTYADLDRAADCVARALLETPGDDKRPVGLLFENGAPFVIASLGTIKAGRIQVALETTAPPARTSYLLDHSQADILLTNTQNVRRASAFHSLPVINIDELDGRPFEHIPAPDPTSEGIVAIDYTSGSTGLPKGMMWDHRGLLRVIARHTNTSHLCRHDRLVMFRASVRAYLSVLLNGGTFYPIDLGYEEPADLARWIAQEKITIYRSAVSTFRSLTNVLAASDQFPSVRLIMLFGEPANFRDVEAYRKHFSADGVLSTSLGCNEMDDYSYFFVGKDTTIPNGVLPGGYPVSDVEVLLLDEKGHRINHGEIGEIAVGARYNPAGYWQEPDLSGAGFVPHPDGGGTIVYRTGDLGRFDEEGCLFHAGRKDFQLKIRGYRVDVGEVEAALLKLKGVKEAAVVGWERNIGDTFVIAYYVPDGSPDSPTASQLRHSVMSEVPDFMVPTRFVVLEKLPLTATGKIDRRALPAPDGLRPQLDTPFVAPRTPVEEALAAIWAEVLGLKTIGVLDKFLELGGDSLRATQVIARLTTQFQVRPPLRTMLEAQTIAELGLVVLKSQAEAMKTYELEQLLGELDALSEVEAQSRPHGKPTGSKATAELALVIPFHNEDRHLPWLIHSLREQDIQNVPIVFVDNASTDGSAALVDACDEVKAGKWLLVQERKIGKIWAIRTGTEFCQERFGTTRVGFLDSDSYLGDSAWIRNSLEIISHTDDRFGFTYSPISYFGLDKWPNFKAAYLVYSDVLQYIVKNVGWLANGQGFVCAIDTVLHYFQNAEITTEIDLRCSLLALLRGQQAFMNPSLLMSSGRRMTANQNTFRAWCFYEREFYSKKDINAGRKLDLKISDRVEDLDSFLVDRFFERRALKIACRHLVPLAIFNENESYFNKMASLLKVDASPERVARLRRYRASEWLLTDRFEDMIRAIEQDSLTIEIAKAIESLMSERYAHAASSR